MLRHIALLHWKNDIQPEALEAFHVALTQLPEKIPQIKSYQLEHDLQLFPHNADYIVIADFLNEKDFQIYAEHPEHIKIINELAKPILASYSNAQFTTSG